MKIVFTEPFKKDYESVTPQVQRALNKALKFLLNNPYHPSLHTKKLPGTSIWYARITRAYRFTFQFEKEEIILRCTGTHDILARERKTS